MDSFLVRFRNPLVLIAIVLLQVIALAVQVQRPEAAGLTPRAEESPRVTLLRHWVVAAVTPFEIVAHGTGRRVRGVWSNYVDLYGVREQNRQLKLETARLREEQAIFAEDAAQGRRLQALLQFKQQYIASTVAAQVIGTSGSDRSRLVYLDKGSEDGLRPEQPVITPDGVVGKLRDVFPHTAQLLLINDPTSGAGVILSATRIRGILRGGPSGQVLINNLTADSRIQPGAAVVTSGGDQVFPRGLPVGVVESIVPDPQHQPYTAITIRPAANLSRLEEVLVITGTQSTLPAAAAGDAQLAQTTAADEKTKAADLLAEKLPSLHEAPPAADSGANAAPAQAGAAGASAQTPPADNMVGGVPGIPNSGLPRTKPALHPDRYSPGATPPAGELTPGAPAVTPPQEPQR